MTMIDLKPHHRSMLTQLAKQHLVQGTELRAYGSRVKGTAIDASDLDLMMFTPEGEVNDLVEFQRALRESNLPIFVQVFDWQYIPTSFKDNFSRTNERLLIVE